jgi:hypothetical protein
LDRSPAQSWQVEPLALGLNQPREKTMLKITDPELALDEIQVGRARLERSEIIRSRDI